MKRYGSIIKLKAEMKDKYLELHSNPWGGISKMIHECNIRNYSIFLRDGYLFSYYEYIGADYSADMAKMKADAETNRWWKETDPCQEPLETASSEEWWALMEEVFHQD